MPATVHATMHLARPHEHDSFAKRRRLARVAHPVVAVHDASSFGNHVFVAMELVDETIRSVARSRTALLEIDRRAVRGCGARARRGARSQGDARFRDVKAANILVGDNRARITDCGSRNRQR